MRRWIVNFHTLAKKAKLNLCCIVVYYGSTFTKEGLKIDTMLLAFGEGKKGRSSSQDDFKVCSFPAETLLFKETNKADHEDDRMAKPGLSLL